MDIMCICIVVKFREFKLCLQFFNTYVVHIISLKFGFQLSGQNFY